MDFLDPKKHRRHLILMLCGYLLIGVAIVIGTLVLLYQAYGFGLGKNGTVIQNGLLFFSSQPHPAKITINSKPQSVQTNSRLLLPAGIYSVQLTRAGYRPWQRTIELIGSSVEHFDYPLLFPQTLTTTGTQGYSAAPGLMTESPDKHWLLVAKPGSMVDFDLYNLKTGPTAPAKAPITLTLPASLLASASTGQGWQVVSWADDNQHVLLQHVYDGKSEYILFDRADPAQSVNLNQTFTGTAFTALSLDNLKYDQYYLYNAADDSLATATLKTTTPVPVLSRVLAYKTYSDNTVLYVTDSGASAGKVIVKEQVSNQTYTIRELAASPTYLLDLATYSDVPYVAAGASVENKVYIYKDPIGQLNASPAHAPVPQQVERVNNPSYVSFSPNAQFILTEGGQNFSVYDVENMRGYSYSLPLALDTPQLHADWMDGDRLTYVSGGKLIAFDYDHTNQQMLEAADPAFVAAFAPDYSYTYTIVPNASTGFELTATSLYTAADR
jgi:hypothetical protein